MKCWCSYMINTDSVSYYDPQKQGGGGKQIENYPIVQTIENLNTLVIDKYNDILKFLLTVRRTQCKLHETWANQKKIEVTIIYFTFTLFLAFF